MEVKASHRVSVTMNSCCTEPRLNALESPAVVGSVVMSTGGRPGSVMENGNGMMVVR